MMTARAITTGKIQSAEYDVVSVGAGFSGLYMLHRLRGAGFTARILERASDVGGTWYWNRYPGARCDVESMQYAYSFSPELEQQWVWTEQYATQPEILSYANHVADRFDLRCDIQFNTDVLSATYDESARCWRIETKDGPHISAAFCIMATGCLSTTNTPHFDGLETFAGTVYHTGEWPHEAVDFTGQQVGIIGTGSSAIQSIPVIAEEATHLYVFQRTPHYTVPARNRYLQSDPETRHSGRRAYGFDVDLTIEEIKADYAGLRERARNMFAALAFTPNRKSALEVSERERQQEFEARWQSGGVPFQGAFIDLVSDRQANETAARFVRQKIGETVHDPVVAKALMPTYTFGCKRLLNIDIRGGRGASLRDKWAEGPTSYLGLGIAGFPNLFTITGPGSPSVLTNMLQSIEQHVDWVVACLEYLRKRDISEIEATPDAEVAWVAHNNEVANDHIRSSCTSWYIGGNIEGKPRVFMPYVGGFPVYVEKCNEIAANGYAGFSLGAVSA